MDFFITLSPFDLMVPRHDELEIWQGSPSNSLYGFVPILADLVIIPLKAEDHHTGIYYSFPNHLHTLHS